MAAGGPQPGGLDKQKMKQILVPALAVAGIVVLAGLVVYLSDGGAPKMPSDGSDGSATDPGLKELAPGVKYRDLKVGLGEECPRGAEVTVHYVGWLTDGAEFDSSRKRNAPSTFGLNRVIAGWGEGIPGMKVGGVRKLVIGPEKGYHDQQKDKIPPNSTLIFEVELVAVNKPPAGGPAVGSTGAGRPMSDGSDGGTDDPGLTDIGGGLKMRDLKEGTGDAVPEGATITIHYTGWIPSGEVFDSSRTKGAPATFPLGNLVQGWQKGIPGMKVGGIRKLVIPPEMGYGRQAQPGIPANSTLIFEIEVLGVK